VPPEREFIQTPMSRQPGYKLSMPGVVVPPCPLLFIQGQAATGDDLSIVVGDTMAEQTHQIFRNFEYIVGEAGGTLDDIVQMLIFVTDIDQFGEFVEVRKDYYPSGKFPPATLVEVTRMANPRFLVEVHAVAALRGDAG
jgi:2-iminobutanoate/2-iminopropanoate deaminase